MTKIENTLAEEIYTALKNNNPLSSILEDKTFTELTDAYIYVMYQQVKERIIYDESSSIPHCLR